MLYELRRSWPEGECEGAPSARVSGCRLALKIMVGSALVYVLLSEMSTRGGFRLASIITSKADAKIFSMYYGVQFV